MLPATLSMATLKHQVQIISNIALIIGTTKNIP